jgi:hypothetical protein
MFKGACSLHLQACMCQQVVHELESVMTHHGAHDTESQLLIP